MIEQRPDNMIKERDYELCEHEKISLDLYENLLNEYPDQVKEIFNQQYCDIEPSFLGFLDIYYHLSKLIEKEWTIVDLGCAYNPQGYYFKDHKKVYSVDVDNGISKAFKFANTEFYNKGIYSFLHYEEIEFPENTFAIMNYCPIWGKEAKQEVRQLVKDRFNHLFCYYPVGKGKLCQIL